MFAHKGVKSPEYPCPEEYTLSVAARFWNVPPWVLLEQSIYWQDTALYISEAEASAQKVIAAHS